MLPLALPPLAMFNVPAWTWMGPLLVSVQGKPMSVL